jgi:flagellar protein FliS
MEEIKMNNVNAYNYYRDQDLETSSNYELVSKLFGAAALNVKKAITYIHEKRLDKANLNMIKAQIIVRTLNESLDKNYVISQQLSPIYDYIIKRLVQANIKKDIAILEEIYGLLIEYRDTWCEAIKIFKISQFK